MPDDLSPQILQGIISIWAVEKKKKKKKVKYKYICIYNISLSLVST